MIKKIFQKIFQTSSSEKRILIKDNYLTGSNENIIRAIIAIKKYDENHEGVIIDIGAFDGETAIQFSKAFPKTKIIAFEANSEILPITKKKCSKFNNIEVLNFAISDRNETLNFYITHNAVSSSLNEVNTFTMDIEEYNNEIKLKNKLSVPAIPLDECSNIEKVLLLKIDTQGHELKVIKGEEKTLKKTKFVLIEMANHELYKNGCQYFEIDEVLRKNNFKLLDIIVTYRKRGIIITEYDALYINTSYIT